MVGGTTAIAAASFGAVAGGTVTSGWLSPAAACLRRECAQNSARSILRAVLILIHLLLKKALSAIDGSVRRRPVCGGGGGLSAAAAAAGSARNRAPSPLCLPGAHSTLSMAGSYLRSPLFVGCAQIGVRLILRSIIILKHFLLKKALSAIDGSQVHRYSSK